MNQSLSTWINSTGVMTSPAPENSSMETGKNFIVTGHRYILDSFTFVIGSVGSVANGFVLLALLCARQSRRKNINVFIINQTTLDLLACLFLILTIVFIRMEITSIPGKWIVCLLFETNTVVAVASYGSIFGLVIITVERYVKIVHPVVHRNHYRRWMTFAGVILPWVDGVCSYLIPAWATVALVDGKCVKFLWPTPAMFSSYTLTMFVLHYVLPPAFFFFAYYSIIGVIRRQVRVNETASTSDSQATRQAGRGQKKHMSQLNVVRTMVIVVVCFCICYLPYKVYMLVITVHIGVRRAPINIVAFYIFTIISFLNRCLNPFIYASQYEVVRRTWTPLAEFLRRHITRKPTTPPAAAVARMEPVPRFHASALARQAGQELPAVS